MDERTLVTAEALARHEVEAGIARAAAMLAVQPHDFDGLCTKCKEQLPQARITFGAVTCIHCQTQIEALRTKR